MKRVSPSGPAEVGGQGGLPHPAGQGPGAAERHRHWLGQGRLRRRGQGTLIGERPPWEGGQEQGKFPLLRFQGQFAAENDPCFLPILWRAHRFRLTNTSTSLLKMSGNSRTISGGRSYLHLAPSRSMIEVAKHTSGWWT